MLEGERRERSGRLGQPVDLRELAFEDVDAALEQVRRDRRRAVGDVLEARRNRRCAPAGSSVRNSITDGTSRAVSIFCSTMVLSSDSGTISRTITSVAPSCMLQIAQPAPPRWNIGMQTSEGPPSRISGISSARHEPGVEHVPAGQHRALGQTGGARRAELPGDRAVGIAMRVHRRRAAARRRSWCARRRTMPCCLNSGPVTISFGLMSSMISLTSRGVRRQLSGAATRPALSSANSNSR